MRMRAVLVVVCVLAVSTFALDVARTLAEVVFSANIIVKDFTIENIELAAFQVVCFDDRPPAGGGMVEQNGERFLVTPISCAKGDDTIETIVVNRMDGSTAPLNINCANEGVTFFHIPGAPDTLQWHINCNLHLH